MTNDESKTLVSNPIFVAADIGLLVVDVFDTVSSHSIIKNAFSLSRIDFHDYQKSSSTLSDRWKTGFCRSLATSRKAGYIQISICFPTCIAVSWPVIIPKQAANRSTSKIR